WTEEIFRLMAARSSETATLGSFTSAVAVRERLAAAGFRVEKLPGFAGKRERIIGEIERPVFDPPGGAPWFAYPQAAGGGRAGEPRRVAVAGAGIAGASIARARARRGIAVTVFDRADGPASGASGNPAALVTPAISRDPLCEFSWQAAGFTRRLAEEFGAPCSFDGVWELASELPGVFSDP